MCWNAHGFVEASEFVDVGDEFELTSPSGKRMKGLFMCLVARVIISGRELQGRRLPVAVVLAVAAAVIQSPHGRAEANRPAPERNAKADLAGPSSKKEELIDMFWREYPAAVTYLEQLYSQVRMTGTLTREVGSEGMSRYHFALARMGDRVKRVLRPESGQKEILIGHPKFSFKARGGESGSGYQLARVSAHDHVVGQIQLLKGKPLVAPFSILDLRILDFLREPDTEPELTGAEILKRDGDPVFKIDFRRIVYRQDRDDIFQTGHFLFDLRRHWAMLEYEQVWDVKSDPGVAYVRGKIEYTDTSNDKPSLESLRFSAEEVEPLGNNSVQKKVSERDHYVVEEFSFGPTPEEEFTPEFYGLPRAGKITETGRGPGWLSLGVMHVVLIAGTVFLICLTWIVIRRRRSRKRI